eukprot:TRINITY_DN6458_c0_g1_i5.p2 TRINITY_DN6458_c0_g1~~TRINITY_DN6458_c0_g1_i5.p2  ORF type:complete len:101 (-),score=7.53 TRINITY_DN6458_c0_g1_i5:1312-1614(-)
MSLPRLNLLISHALTSTIDFSGLRLYILGSSAMAPTRTRNVTAMCLRTARKTFLFDCGEATQHQLFQMQLTGKQSDIAAIFITHLHGDHVNISEFTYPHL